MLNEWRQMLSLCFVRWCSFIYAYHRQQKLVHGYVLCGCHNMIIWWRSGQNTNRLSVASSCHWQKLLEILAAVYCTVANAVSIFITQVIMLSSWWQFLITYGVDLFVCRCAGVCSYEGHGGLCSIRLSEPLLKFRPRKDLIETLLVGFTIVT